MGVTQQVPKIYKYDFILQIARALQERCDMLVGKRWHDEAPVFGFLGLYDGGNVCAQLYQKFYYDIVRSLEDGGWYYYQQGQFKTVTVQYVCSLLGFQMPPNPPIVGQILHRQKYVDFLKFICTAISCMNIRRRNKSELYFTDFHVNIRRGGSEINYHEGGLQLRYKSIASANKHQSYLQDHDNYFSIYREECFLLDSYRKYYSSSQQKYVQDGMSQFIIGTQFVVTNLQESSWAEYSFNKTAYPVNFLGYVQREYPAGWNQTDHPQLCFKELPPPQQVANKTPTYVSLWADWVASNCVKISDDLYMYETVSVEPKQSFKQLWGAFTDRPTQITRDDLLPNFSTANYNAQKYAEIQDSSYPEYPRYSGSFRIRCAVGGFYKPQYVKFHFQHNPTI